MGEEALDYKFVEAKGIPAGSLHSRRDTLGRPIARTVYPRSAKFKLPSLSGSSAAFEDELAD